MRNAVGICGMTREGRPTVALFGHLKLQYTLNNGSQLRDLQPLIAIGKNAVALFPRTQHWHNSSY